MSQAMTKFGRNLYIALYDKKMSQTKLSEMVGVKRETISRYVSGEKTPSSDTLIKIADALGVTVDSLVK